METWNLFSGSDIALAVLGLAGFASVAIVLRTAFGNMTKREINIRSNAQRAQSQARD